MTTLTQQNILIGTLVSGSAGTANYIKQILPHGFESFSITFWQRIGDIDLKRLAEDVLETIDGRAVISSLGIYGNPLETNPDDEETRRGWEILIDHAHLFGAGIVAGFAGRIREKPVDESMPRFKEVFEPLARRAADRNVRLAFENCPMGGDWNRGDWNIAFHPKAWEMMFNALPQTNIGLEWEPCHQMIQLIDPIPQLRAWVNKIFHVHGKCATIKRDILAREGIAGPTPFAFHRMPGFGDANWTDIISELRGGGFSGSIDIEGWHDPVYKGDLEMTGQVHGLRYLKNCRGGEFVPNPG